MKINFTVATLILMTALCSCTQKNVRDWDDAKIEKWLADSRWITELGIAPDSTMDQRQFVEQNLLNPQSWEAAYAFLAKGGFDTMATGKYELLNDGTFATVADYMTKDSAQFEAHKKYIDIQYVSSGREYILKSSLEKMTPSIAYDNQNDIEFFSAQEYVPVYADSTRIIVLFPSDGHKPCMKVDTNGNVRKVVVKIPYVE